MKGKKGSAIAEAAIVFPIVIIVVMTVIYILITLYVDASSVARDHLALRAEAGQKSETVSVDDNFSNIAPKDKYGRRPFVRQVCTTEEFRFPDRLLLADEGRVYIIDEAFYIRVIDFLGGISRPKDADFVEEDEL